MTSEQSFNRELADRVLEASCRQVQLDTRGAQLLRFGENAIYLLPATRIVVRIARSISHWADAVKEVAVSKWFTEVGIRAARVWPIEQPIEVLGHPVTFWHFIDGRRGQPSDIEHLATMLRRVHQLPSPVTFALPVDNILERIAPRIAKSEVPDGDRRFLTTLLANLSAEVRTLSFPLSESVLHGDAHVQNLMVTASGPVLIDFERVTHGQPEWDLSMTATEYVTAGWWTDDQYQAFVRAYGFDIVSWSGFRTLRRVHELKMTTWLMQNIAESTEIRSEYELRMLAVRTGESTVRWTAF